MIQLRAVFLSILASAAVGGCSGNSNNGAQSAVNISVEPGLNSNGTCGVGAGATMVIGDPGNATAVGNGGSEKDDAGSHGVSVQCKVSGNDSSGYSVTAQVTEAGIGSFLIQGQFPGAVSGVVPQATGITAQYSSSAGFIANLSDSTCTVTFPTTASTLQGIAPGQVAANIDCTNASDPNRAGTATGCEISGSFLFQNCNK
jgi:hypothetical protein